MRLPVIPLDLHFPEEGYYNATLTGVNGRQYGYINNNSDVEQTIIEPTDGKSIETSLDLGLQQIVEKYVNTFEEKMGAKNVGVIIEDPKTGEILAMDGGDRYDLNNPRDLSNVYSQSEIAAMNDEETVEALNGMWSNFCVTDAYEPGSVVKPIVMGSALEMGAISESDNFVCDGGQSFGADGATTFIICAVWPDAHGTEALSDVIANSCNDGMMQIAAKMGKDNFLKTQSVFNFGTRTGIDLPNEGSGVIHTSDTMGETELACSAFGQGYTLTMIQEINAMCSVINGGSYYEPHVMRQIMNEQGSVVETKDPVLVRETVSSSTSEFLKEAMFQTVENGTGGAAKVAGYHVGGKTGTAEKQPRSAKNYLLSFAGFAPAEDPQLFVYVVVDVPNYPPGPQQAHSSFASGIFAKIMAEALPYMNVFPEAGAEEEQAGDTAADEGINEPSGSEGEETEPETETQETEKVYETDETIGDGYESGLPDGVPAAPTAPSLSLEETSDGWKEKKESQSEEKEDLEGTAGETKASSEA